MNSLPETFNPLTYENTLIDVSLLNNWQLMDTHSTDTSDKDYIIDGILRLQLKILDTIEQKEKQLDFQFTQLQEREMMLREREILLYERLENAQSIARRLYEYTHSVKRTISNE